MVNDKIFAMAAGKIFFFLKIAKIRRGMEEKERKKKEKH